MNDIDQVRLERVQAIVLQNPQVSSTSIADILNCSEEDASAYLARAQEVEGIELTKLLTRQRSELARELSSRLSQLKQLRKERKRCLDELSSVESPRDRASLVKLVRDLDAAIGERVGTPVFDQVRKQVFAEQLRKTLTDGDDTPSRDAVGQVVEDI